MKIFHRKNWKKNLNIVYRYHSLIDLAAQQKLTTGAYKEGLKLL